MFEEQTSRMHLQDIKTACHEDMRSLSACYEVHCNNERNEKSDY